MFGVYCECDTSAKVLEIKMAPVGVDTQARYQVRVVASRSLRNGLHFPPWHSAIIAGKPAFVGERWPTSAALLLE
jgi:hypothetical protein